MKIKIEALELKTLLEKVLPVTDKKMLPSISGVLLRSKNNVLSATTTNLSNHLTVNTKDYTAIEDDTILIKLSEIAIMTKLSGELQIESLDTFEAIVKSPKKSITINLLDVEMFITLPENTETEVNMTMKETDFLRSINKLITFTSSNENNKVMECYNIDFNHSRMEALDGHRIGINDLNITINSNNTLKAILINNSINSNLKKVLSSKTENNITFTKSDKYLYIVGENFEYIQHNGDEVYYKIDQMLFTDYEFKINIEAADLMEIAKFNIDMLKADITEKKPMAIYYNNETQQHYVYMNTGSHKTVDKLETIKSEMKNKDFTIAFNPKFIYEALKCIDDKQVEIIGMNPKAPILIKGDNELYLVLPVNMVSEFNSDIIEAYIKKVA